MQYDRFIITTRGLAARRGLRQFYLRHELKPQLEEQVVERRLSNVRFPSYQAKARLAESLSAADLHLVPLDPRVASCLMPSKLYGVLASGAPLVAAIAPEDCELARLTRDHEVGVVAPPGEPEALADMIRQLADQGWQVREMGARARQLAESTYRRECGTAQFRELLTDLAGFETPSHLKSCDEFAAAATASLSTTTD